jgi:hypothetical protein
LQVSIDISNIADIMGKTKRILSLAGREAAQENVRSHYN